MGEVTAEMIERGRGADRRLSSERRRLAQKVKEAREKLTSGGQGHGAFEGDLLRLYAESRINSTPWTLLTAFAIAGVLMLWAPLEFVQIWAGCIVLAVWISYVVAAIYLKSAPLGPVPKWRRRFVAVELLLGLTWAAVALLLVVAPQSAARTFLLAILPLVGAMNAMVTATIPRAVYSTVLPMGFAVVVMAFSTERNTSVLVTTAFVCGAEVYFVMLARRLYRTTLKALYAQAEKDGLIVELEQAKANSDEARRRAEESSLAKSRFLATMSHELRTPLNAILGFSEIMTAELYGPHAAPLYRDYSNYIHTSGEHLLALINEILDLSRVEAGRYELKEDAISLTAIVEDCQRLLALRAQKRGIEISEAVEQELPRLWADERAVRQIVLNLLTNAVKFTPQGGQVVIKIGWTAAGGQYFSVRDTGPGIPESEIPTVMSSFGRGALALKHAEEGSGLGLPIVKGLVELHGGHFILRSKVREGTEVIVIFPPARIMNALPRFDGEAEWRQKQEKQQRPAA